MSGDITKIPVIDLFAGRGGLGEGFSAYAYSGDQPFQIKLSIEKDPAAHRTLQLRSFFRQFPQDKVIEYLDRIQNSATLAVYMATVESRKGQASAIPRYKG